MPLDNPKKTEHLLALDGAKERLQIFKASLLEEGSFDSAIDACDGVFHIVCPISNDPQVNMIPYTFFFLIMYIFIYRARRTKISPILPCPVHQTEPKCLPMYFLLICAVCIFIINYF